MIIICEPQCVGFEHAEVNGALIGVYRIAFPNDPIRFAGEQTHVDEVKRLVASRGIPEIEFVVISVAPRRSSNLRRFFTEHGVYRSLFRMTEGREAHVVFCSVTSPGLYWIKFLIRRFHRVRALAVLHGIVESVVHWKELLWQQVFFWFRIPLLFLPHSRLKYLVFGEFIKSALTRQFSSLGRQLVSMDLPYEFREPSARSSPSPGVIRFGSLGVGSRSKGTDEFFECARRMGGETFARSHEFVLVGPLMDESIQVPTGVVVHARNRGMSQGEYDVEAASIDYAVFYHRQDHYRFSTSAALFDAFSFVKPIIALRNPVFEYYFDLMGDIGYLCADFREMENKVKEILNHFDSMVYDRQKANILAGRSKLTATALSKKVGSFWDP